MASVRERNGRYLGYYKVQGKQQGAGTWETYDEALAASLAAEEGARGSAVITVPGPPGVLTVAGYMPGFLTNHDVKEITRQSMRMNAKCTVRHLGAVPLKGDGCLTPAMVRQFKRRLEDCPLSPDTVGKIISVLRVMSKTAVTDGLMPTDPTATIKGGGGNAEMRIAPRPAALIAAVAVLASAAKTAKPTSKTKPMPIAT